MRSLWPTEYIEAKMQLSSNLSLKGDPLETVTGARFGGSPMRADSHSGVQQSPRCSAVCFKCDLDHSAVDCRRGRRLVAASRLMCY